MFHVIIEIGVDGRSDGAVGVEICRHEASPVASCTGAAKMHGIVGVTSIEGGVGSRGGVFDVRGGAVDKGTLIVSVWRAKIGRDVQRW